MSATRVALIDYGMGNRRSVEKALQHVGATVERVSDGAQLEQQFDALVIPGQGAFPEAMRRLAEQELVEPLQTAASAGTPLLGICLGLQLLFDSSDEHEGAQGFGLISGSVRKLESAGQRLPLIGWVPVIWNDQELANDVPQAHAFYHLHSYCAVPDDVSAIAATAEYGEQFATAVRKENVFGVQFHPEKSSRDGLKLLDNFVNRIAGSQ